MSQLRSVTVGEAIPNEHGAVELVVQVDEDLVRYSASPLGLGVKDDVPVELANAGWHAAEEYLRQNRDRMRELYRVAARLRRRAGNPPMIGQTRSPAVRVLSKPTKRKLGAMIKTEVGLTEVRVHIGRDGSLADDCDDWALVSDADRDAAIGAALQWVFEHRAEARGVGLDVDLLEELWT